MRTFHDLQKLIAKKPRARSKGSFAYAHNTRIHIYQAKWPHHPEPLETYAVCYHSTEIIYLCHDAVASYAFRYDDSKTTNLRLGWFQSSDGVRFHHGKLMWRWAKVMDLKARSWPGGSSTDMTDMVVFADHPRAPAVWLPDGRRFWLRTDDKSVMTEAQELLQAMIAYAEPFTSQLSAPQLDAFHARWHGRDGARVGMAVAAMIAGKPKLALARLVHKLDRRYTREQTGLPDEIVQMMMGLATAREIASDSSLIVLTPSAKAIVGITHLQNIDTGERVYLELDGKPPEGWLVPHAYPATQPSRPRAPPQSVEQTAQTVG